jgi:uncharacterized protein
VVVDRGLRVTMGDGTVLLADRWAPEPVDGHGGPNGPGSPPPIVLLRSPYGRRQLAPVAHLFAERGYQAVIESCRGTFGSGGKWDPFRHEREDGRDTLAWLADQPWFGGSVVLFGPSYLGLVQWAVCEGLPPFVRAMAPAVTAADFRDSVVYPGNALAIESMLSWIYQLEHQEEPGIGILASFLRARRVLPRGYAALPVGDADRRTVHHRVPFFQDWLEHEAPGDPWWQPVDFRAGRLEAPPATFQGGWYDMFLPAQMDDFAALRAAGRDVRITIGPWTHASPPGLVASLRDSMVWFDEHTRNAGSTAQPTRAHRVRLHLLGARRWVDLPDWPPPADRQPWFLHTDGRLDRTPPAPGGPDRFRYDPEDPTPACGGPSLDMRSAGRKDQRRREARPDVLVYTSEPMTEPMTVVGPLGVRLHVRSSLDHFDVVARLCVVSDKGRSTNLADGVLRLRPGDAEAGPDGVLAVDVPMWPTAVTFRAGERVRLQVSSGAHPLFARNSGTGEPLTSGLSLRIAHQELFHDPQRPSAITLPVVRL